MTDIRFVITGQEVEAAASLLSDTLTEGEENTAVSRIEPSTLPEAARKIIDPFSIALVVLSIPGAVLSTIDLVDRRRKRVKAQALIDATTRVQQQYGAEASIVMADGTPRPLDKLTPDELLEIAAKLAQGK